MKELFKTVHGSHLYGLAHAGSDLDYYTVVEKVPSKKKKYARQSVVDRLDSTVLDLPTWLNQCAAGVPQALEAMFSPMPVHSSIEYLRGSYRANTGCWERFLRTVKSFSLQEDLKSRRHSARLALEFNSMARHGRFNPVLTEQQKSLVMDSDKQEDVYKYAMELAWN